MKKRQPYKKYLFPLANGKFLEVQQRKIQNAMPYIQEKIEYYLPIETVDVEDVRDVIRYIRVNVNRPCSAEEVNGLVKQIKALMLDALDHMEKHDRYLYENRSAINRPKIIENGEGEENDEE